MILIASETCNTIYSQYKKRISIIIDVQSQGQFAYRVLYTYTLRPFLHGTLGSSNTFIFVVNFILVGW